MHIATLLVLFLWGDTVVPKLPVVGNQSVLQVSPSPGPSPPLASSTQQCRGSLVTWGLSQAKQGCGVLSGPCPQVEWLDPTVAPFLIFGKAAAIQKSVMTVLIYIPINSLEWFHFLHILTNNFYLVFLIIIILTGVR